MTGCLAYAQLSHHIIGEQRANERDALGCTQRQIEPVHTALTERAPMRTVRRDAVVEPTGHQLRIGVTTGALSIGQPHQGRNGVGVTGQQPDRVRVSRSE